MPFLLLLIVMALATTSWSLQCAREQARIEPERARSRPRLLTAAAIAGASALLGIAFACDVVPLPGPRGIEMPTAAMSIVLGLTAAGVLNLLATPASRRTNAASILLALGFGGLFLMTPCYLLVLNAS